jgi:hypothetical protein
MVACPVRFSRTLSESSTIPEVPVLLVCLHSLSPLFDCYFIAQLIKESAEEPPVKTQKFVLAESYPLFRLSYGRR